MTDRLPMISAIGVAVVLLVACRPAPGLAPVPVPDPIADPGAPTDSPPKYSVVLDPIRGGDTLVTGSGPAGLPIRLVDISQVGYSYGETIIDQDGRFTFQLAETAVGGSRLGVLLANLAGSKFTPADFSGRDVPLVGLVIASQLVAK